MTLEEKAKDYAENKKSLYYSPQVDMYYDDEKKLEEAYLAGARENEKELQEHHKKACEEFTNTHRTLGEKIKDLKKQIEKLELYKKAFCIFVNWITECDFGYDNIPDEFEKYKAELEEKELGYTEGLMYIALKEVKNNDFDFIKKEVENIDKVI